MRRAWQLFASEYRKGRPRQLRLYPEFSTFFSRILKNDNSLLFEILHCHRKWPVDTSQDLARAKCSLTSQQVAICSRFSIEFLHRIKYLTTDIQLVDGS